MVAAMGKKFEGSGRKVDLGALPPPRVVKVKRKAPAAEGDAVINHGNSKALREHGGRATLKVKGKGKGRKPPKDKVAEGNAKAMDAHQRARPTPEQVSMGVFSIVPGERFDTERKGEHVLVNLAARSRGAAMMFARGQIKARELQAATMLCQYAELAQTSQLSGLPLGERVDGGTVDTTGNRLRAAGVAFGRYREALESLTTAGRVLVENVIVRGMPMDEAVRLRTVAHRLGSTGNLDTRRTKAFVVVSEALELLAEHFGLPVS